MDELIDMDKLDKAIYKAIELVYTAELIKRPPRKTGFVASQWETIHPAKFQYFIINPYGDIITFLEEGTRPHIIRPKTKKMLKFPIDKAPQMRDAKSQKMLAKHGEIWFYGKGGKPQLGYKKEGSRWFVFAKEVKHPGTEAQLFIEDILSSSDLFEKFKKTIAKFMD